jgi:signal transduction histidine kinase
MITDRIEAILNSVSRRVEELIPSQRFYVVLYDHNKGEFSFPLVREEGIVSANNQSPWIIRPIHPGNSLPDWVISNNTNLLIEKDLSSHLQQNQIEYWPDDQIPYSWLGVPMTIGGQVAGALVIERWQSPASLDGNDLRVLATVARQTAIAIENARIGEQLQQKIAQLRILNHMGQQLTKGLAKQEKDILELIYNSVSRLEVDTRNMDIAFYEPDPADTKDEIFGHLRFVLAFDEGVPISIPDRRAGRGLTEYVIRTKASFNPSNIAQIYPGLAEDQTGKIPQSWLGVPMISDGQVFGVIVLRNNDIERAYTEDDQEILEILASQAAVSLQAQREQLRKIEMEKIFAMGTMAAEFAHKMNNLAGTIPVRVNLARNQLDLSKPRDDEVNKQLTRIEVEANNLLHAAQEIRKAIELGETRIPEEIRINELVETAMARARNTRLNLESQVDEKFNLGSPLPLLKADRNALLDSLTNIIKNGFEAIEEKGVVEVCTRIVEIDIKTAIEVEIKDSGKGIPASQLSKIFDLFYTTKGDNGLGFGLWRDKVFIKKLGGEIDVYSEENHGSTFIIRIPVNYNVPEPNEQ